MMQLQMMEQLDKKMQQKNFEDNSNFRRLGLNVFFISSPQPSEQPPVTVQCMPDEKLSEIIEKYRKKSGNFEPDIKFIFNAKALNPNLTLAEAGLTEGSNIYVHEPQILG